MKGLPPSKSPLSGGGTAAREWYDWFLYVAKSLEQLFTGTGGGLPPGSVTFTQSDVVLGRTSPGGGAAQEVPFTDQAQALADDTSFAQMRNTLGIDASTTPYTPEDLSDWDGLDPGNVDDALDYLAANSFDVDTILTDGTDVLVGGGNVLVSS